MRTTVPYNPGQTPTNALPPRAHATRAPSSVTTQS
jgi:hypothetical protein